MMTWHSLLLPSSWGGFGRNSVLRKRTRWLGLWASRFESTDQLFAFLAISFMLLQTFLQSLHIARCHHHPWKSPNYKTKTKTKTALSTPTLSTPTTLHPHVGPLKMHRDRIYATSFLLFGGGVHQSAEAAATLTKCSTEEWKSQRRGLSNFQEDDEDDVPCDVITIIRFKTGRTTKKCWNVLTAMMMGSGKVL